MQDITGDGGVFKKKLRPGSTEHVTKPKPGDAVDVHYVGTIAETGQEFDSSREYEGQKPLRFGVGSSSVVSGFDAAVQTMVVGEVSRFEIRADYAYGDKGAPSNSTLAPDIKPGQAIVFELELMQIVGSDSIAAAEETNESNRRTLDLERLALLRQERAKALAEREALKAKAAEAAKAKAKAEEQAKQTSAAVASSGGGLDKKTVKKMNPKALKVQLKKLGLSIQGNKKTLQARLLATL